jgi:hypothetical protein
MEGLDVMLVEEEGEGGREELGGTEGEGGGAGA